MQSVFGLTADAADRRGLLSLLRLCLRELRDLPGAIAREYRRARRNRIMSRKSFLIPEFGSWRESLFALAPFLLLGVLPPLLSIVNMPYVHTRVAGSFALGLLGLLLCLGIAGVIKSLPRWALPYLGLVLSILSVYVFGRALSGLYYVFVSQGDPWFARQVVYQGQCWVGMLVAAVVIVVAAAALSFLRPFYRRIRDDWTLLSFGLYGGALFALFITLDDYAGEEIYRLTSVLLLASGGWGYLRARRSWQRALILFVAFTLAMAVAAGGKAILYSSPDWPGPRYFTPQSEAMSTVIMWAWLAIAIFAPIVLNLLPSPDSRASAAV